MGPSDSRTFDVGSTSLLAIGLSDSRRKIVLIAIATVCFMFIAHLGMPDQTMERKAPGEFLLHHADRIGQDTLLISGDDSVHAVCWF